jgi:DNA-binding NarL/FixJ family response regulator
MHQNEFTIMRMMRNGARGFLPKEAGPKDLRYAMDAMREGYVYYSNLLDEKIILRAQEGKESKMLDLTDTEINFLRYCCTDLVYKEIAPLMNLGQRTIDWYRDKMYEKLGVNTRTGLVLFAMQFGLEPHDVKNAQ